MSLTLPTRSRLTCEEIMTKRFCAKSSLLPHVVHLCKGPVINPKCHPSPFNTLNTKLRERSLPDCLPVSNSGSSEIFATSSPLDPIPPLCPPPILDPDDVVERK